MKYTPKDFDKRSTNATVLLGCRVTAAERKTVAEVARRLGTNVSTLVRRCLRDAGVMKSDNAKGE